MSADAATVLDDETTLTSESGDIIKISCAENKEDSEPIDPETRSISIELKNESLAFEPPVETSFIKTSKVSKRMTMQNLKSSEPITVARPFATYEDSQKSGSLYARVFGRRLIPKEFKAPEPANRSVSDGPVDFQSVAAPVRKTNPVLDELLHALQLISTNSPDLRELDLKDCPILSVKLCTALASALQANTELKKLSLANCKIQTSSAMEIAEALRVNIGLEFLNLESNQIAPLGMRSLADMLEFNKTLKELKLSHQQQKTGTEAEQTFARTIAKNESLTKLSLVIRDVSSRHSVERACSRNKEIARRKNFAAS